MAGMNRGLRKWVPIGVAFLAGAGLMAGLYLGVLTWLEGWGYASFQFVRDRAYVLPIILAFGVQAALFVAMRLRLYGSSRSTAKAGVMVGTSGGTSATAMVACCLHHTTNVLPILGISAITGFLARYQRPFLQMSLLMNLAGIIVMMLALQRERQGLTAMPESAS